MDNDTQAEEERKGRRRLRARLSPSISIKKGRGGENEEEIVLDATTRPLLRRVFRSVACFAFRFVFRRLGRVHTYTHTQSRCCSAASNDPPFRLHTLVDLSPLPHGVSPTK